VQVPVLAGSGLLSTAEDAAAAADKIGYPVLLKATGGGGGRGIFICRNAGEVLSQFSISQKQGEQFFGNSGVSGAGAWGERGEQGRGGGGQGGWGLRHLPVWANAAAVEGSMLW
jgi:hypothetical protein